MKSFLDKVILGLWLAIVAFIILAAMSISETGAWKAGWMGYGYFGLACVSFIAIRMLRAAQEWIEPPGLEEI